MQSIESQIIGKSKKEIVELLGDQFNIPYAKIWKYEIKKNMLFTKLLILYFDDDMIVYDCEYKYCLNF